MTHSNEAKANNTDTNTSPMPQNILTTIQGFIEDLRKDPQGTVKNLQTTAQGIFNESGLLKNEGQGLAGEQAPSFIQNGYLFAGKMRRKAGLAPDSNQPVTFNLLGTPSVLVRGAEGVRYFYDTTKVKRAGAMPAFISGPLFGKGAVHGLDGQEHLDRKNMMVNLAYDDARVEQFKHLVAEETETMLSKWGEQEGNVYDDAAIAYGRAAFRWAGIPVSDEEMEERAAQCSRLLDTFGSPLTNIVAWRERRSLDMWYEQIIAKVRSGEMTVGEDSVVAHLAASDLEDRTAGIELQNLTRPTIAVSRFAAFAAAALVENQEWIERIRHASNGQLIDVPEAIAFAQEIRRTKPFVPMLPATAIVDGEVSGCPIKKGQRVLIDILNTNTGPDWDRPGTFDPSRFLNVDGESIETFVPQGGGNVRTGHRCPGEKIAVTALSVVVAALCRPDVRISDDQEDTTFSWTRMLTRPTTGVRVSR
ncbi:Fatty-acid peroxygenase [Corynebacterium kalinowskii]|uniref:Fatty-acid peroxygenase n=1 Tax=Corynebacterium kalinowskii TaxID=2675216 RepID=A0A6B8VN86_9CORY|nr:cytochrome P450 [Corynebacterium kalinowskii]QGU00997.1 Fatty-acid peroxygenase [Corynebacterium kalinowskii]